jgi:hypothetical protein
MTIKDQYFISILTARELASRDRRRNELISL